MFILMFIRIAEGTAGELKDRMGGDVLVARVADRADLPRASDPLASLRERPPMSTLTSDA